VGHVYLELVDKVPRPVRQPQRWGYVTNVYVRPHHRGAGIGSLLLDAAIRWAKEQGVEFLIVWPSEESVGLYARHGFEPASEPMIRELAGDGC
jgi:GNAT superfamily N-acetyltransferase